MTGSRPMRRADKILYSLFLIVGIALPVILTLANYALYESRSLTIMQILSVMIYMPLAFWIAMALTGDGKHLTEGNWDGFSWDKKEAFKELAVPIGKLLTAVLVIGAVVLEIVLFLLPPYSWMIVLITVSFALVVSIVGIKHVAGRAEMNGGSRSSLLSRRDKMALTQISFTSVLLLAIMLPITLFISGGIGGSFSVTMSEEKLSIDAPLYDWDIAYSEISEYDLKDGTFEVRRVFGLGNHEIIAGRLYNDEIGDCNGAIYRSTDACVLIKTYDGTYYVFNDESIEGTVTLYSELLTHLS